MRTWPRSAELNKLLQALLFILLSCILVFLATREQVLSGDVAWFISAGQRMFSGLSSVDEFWDTNPPYNFLFYVPMVVVIQILDMNPVTVATIFHTSFILFNAGVISLVFSGGNLFASGSKWLVTSAYIIVCFSFLLPAHKDSLILMALPATVIFQYAIAQRVTTSSAILCLALGLNALVIFLKPHFLIIPALLILCRGLKDHRLKSFFACDHLVFLGLGLTYTAITLIFFRNFLFEKIEIIWDLYANVPYEPTAASSAAIICIGMNITLLSAAAISSKTDIIKLSALLASASLCAIVVYHLQYKGFWEHLLPALSLLIMAILLMVAHYVQIVIRLPPRILAICFIFLACAYQPFTIKHDIKKSMDATKSFQEYVGAKIGRKPFFIEDTATTLPYITEIETGGIHASHFPSMWMISGFLSQGYSIESECLETCGIFSEILLDGFERYDPQILFLYQDGDAFDPIQTAGVLKFLKSSRRFQEFMSHYSKMDNSLVIFYKTGQKKYSIYTKK